jgi:hypothetical protein
VKYLTDKQILTTCHTTEICFHTKASGIPIPISVWPRSMGYVIVHFGSRIFTSVGSIFFSHGSKLINIQVFSRSRHHSSNPQQYIHNQMVTGEGQLQQLKPFSCAYRKVSCICMKVAGSLLPSGLTKGISR